MRNICQCFTGENAKKVSLLLGQESKGMPFLSKAHNVQKMENYQITMVFSDWYQITMNLVLITSKWI